MAEMAPKFQEPVFAKHRVALFEQIYARQHDQAVLTNEPITITLGNGTLKDGIRGVTTPLAIAESIFASTKQFVAAKVDGQLWDLIRPLEGSCTLELLKFDSPEGAYVFWHSSAHVLGEALEWRYADGRLCIGPPIERGGFYYDISLPEGQFISAADYKDIEAFVGKIVKEKQPFQRVVLTKEEALEMFKFNKFKLEIINEKIVDGTTCTAYRCGPLIDLCRGPHVPNTGVIKAFAVHKNSAAYWKGQQDRESLQRVYGISFPDNKGLKEWKKFEEMAALRNHRKIGREQKLFFFNDLSPGSCFFLPHGTRIYNTLITFIREQYWKRGYTEVITPNVYNVDLWKTSGHYAHYKENMFILDCDKTEFALKPMNCPGHCVMFGHHQHSYKDLPLRYADFGVLHRNEAAGALTGLTRVRRFQQDDAHIFCRRDQIQEEISGVLDMLRECYGIFGFEFRLALSTRPEKALGEVELWAEAEEALKQSLIKFCGDNWGYNHGDGAFYGPKIDIELTDALNRRHQCATIQLDFQLPINFQLKFEQYDASDKVDEAEQDPIVLARLKEERDAKTRPVMIHRAILGSVERFMAVMIEHTGGIWPFWLSPRQCIVIPLAEAFNEYTISVRDRIHSAGFFVDANVSQLSYKKKIALAQVASQAGEGAFVTRYNFICVVGASEVENGTVDVRTPNNEGKRRGKMTIDDLIAMFKLLASSRAMSDEADV